MRALRPESTTPEQPRLAGQSRGRQDAPPGIRCPHSAPVHSPPRNGHRPDRTAERHAPDGQAAFASLSVLACLIGAAALDRTGVGVRGGRGRNGGIGARRRHIVVDRLPRQSAGHGRRHLGRHLHLANPAWTSPVLDGQVYGEPLEATGRVFVATENDTMYALAANTGAVLWSTHVGTPVPSGDLPCGDISPTVGITGTPVVDVARGEIFAVADELSRQCARPLPGRASTCTPARRRSRRGRRPPGTAPGGDPAAHRPEPQQRQRGLRLRRQRR